MHTGTPKNTWMSTHTRRDNITMALLGPESALDWHCDEWPPGGLWGHGSQCDVTDGTGAERCYKKKNGISVHISTYTHVFCVTSDTFSTAHLVNLCSHGSTSAKHLTWFLINKHFGTLVVFFSSQGCQERGHISSQMQHALIQAELVNNSKACSEILSISASLQGCWVVRVQLLLKRCDWVLEKILTSSGTEEEKIQKIQVNRMFVT